MWLWPGITLVGAHNPCPKGILVEVTSLTDEEVCLSNGATLRPEQVKAIRERSGLSQVAFATILGMSPATINRYEMGSPLAVKEDNLIRMAGIPSAMRMLMQQRGHLLKPGQRPA